jgi:hypothetical protein
MQVNIDINYNNWLKEIPKDEVESTVNKYLKLGYLTSTLTTSQLNISNEIFNPIQNSLDQISQHQENKLELIGTQINENLDFVKQSIDKLTQYTNKSVTKGFYGEKCVEELISQNFPDYTITNNTHNPHNSDYELQNLKGQKFMIEVKNYTRNVPTSEVNKFISDLESSNIEIGLFFSLNTGICNKKRFKIDTLESNKKIIYLPNIQQETSMIIMAILMAESLYDVQLNSNKKINECNLMIIYEELQLFYDNYNSLIQTVKDSKNSIEKTLFNMYNSLIDHDLKIKNYLKNVQIRMNEELFNFNSIYIESKYNDLEILINNIQDKHVKSIYYDLLKYISEKEFNVKIDQIDNYHWIINDNYEIQLNKKKINLIIEGNNIQIFNSKLFSQLII